MLKEKRIARVGDRIRIVCKMCSVDPYEVGDELEVKRVEDSSDFKGSITETDKHVFGFNRFNGIMAVEYEVIVGEETEE